jgi:hypothetical protein
MQTKKVSEPSFLHQIKRCFGILFGLSAQVSMAFIFEINTTYNFIHIQFHAIYIKSYILPTNIPAKNLKIVTKLTGYSLF